MGLLRREVLVAANVSLFSTFLQIIFMAYLGIHLNTFETAALVIGFVFGVRNFVQIFFRIPIGEFSQVVGRKPLLLTGMVFYSIAHFILYLSNHWVHDLIATIFLAFGMSFHYPSIFAYIGDIAENNYGRINGIVFQGSDIAVIVGTFIVKILLDEGSFVLNLNYLTFGLVDIGKVTIGFNDPISLNSVFLGSFVVGVIGVLLNSIMIRETLSDKERKIVTSKIRSLGQSFRYSFQSFVAMSKEPKLRPVYFFQMVVAFGEFFFQSFIGLLIVLSLGYQDSDVAAVISIGTLLLFPFKPFLGAVSDKFGYKRPILFSLVFNGILLFLVTQTTELWMVTVVYSLYMANNITSYLAVNGATSYNSENTKRGVAMGVLGVYVSIGRTISSLTLGVLWEVLTRMSDDKGESLIRVFQVTCVILIIASMILYHRTKSLLIKPISESVAGTMNLDINLESVE
ncbi:MAG: MFS transporter [Candidatus Kariarchaeaceae archaeon]